MEGKKKGNASREEITQRTKQGKIYWNNLHKNEGQSGVPRGSYPVNCKPRLHYPWGMWKKRKKEPQLEAQIERQKDENDGEQRKKNGGKGERERERNEIEEKKAIYLPYAISQFSSFLRKTKR